jgi:hypothetical protein
LPTNSLADRPKMLLFSNASQYVYISSKTEAGRLREKRGNGQR